MTDIKGHNPMSVAIAGETLLTFAETVQNIPEIVPQGGARIVFYGGFHAYNATPQEKALQRGDSGQNSHVWDANVAQACKNDGGYKLFGLDGVYPIVNSANEDPSMDLERVWLILPGSPSQIGVHEIYQKAHVFVVGGDPGLYEAFLTIYGYPTYANIKKIDTANNSMTTNVEEEILPGFEALIKNTAAVGAAVTVFAFFKWLKEKNDKREKQNTEKVKGMVFSRRKLLQIGGLILGASAVSALAPIFSALDKEPTSRRFLLNLTQIANDAKLPGDTWVNGRTAIVIAKTAEVHTILVKDGKLQERDASAVVMGDTHEFGAEKFMNDKNARMEAIKAFVESGMALIVDAIKSAYPKITEDDLQKGINRILADFTEFISLYTLYDVTDPPEGVKDLISALPQYVRPLRSYHCREVDEVLLGLRQKYTIPS